MDEIIKTRLALELLFAEGVIPTQKDFKALIDSVVVKRDDKIFGKWKSGVGYVEGDVVLYQDEETKQLGIYVFVSKKTAKALDPNCNSDDDCGNDPPKKCCRWQLIHLDLGDDGDWHIDKTTNTLYAKVYGKAGIGTETPNAFFHLNDKQGAGSQFLFNPLGETKSPMLQMKNGGHSNLLPEGTQVEHWLDENAAQWLTNTPLGFVFKKQALRQTANAQMLPNTDGTSRDTREGSLSEDMLLLVISNEGRRPRIGIGTETPNATLDVVNEGTGATVQLDVDTNNNPQIILLKTTEGNQLEIVQSLENQTAMWTTNAAHGFLFNHQNKETVVSFHKNGNVGIGTSEPSTKLEIIDNAAKNGKFNFDVSESIPMMEITNLLEEEGEVKMSIAVHTDSAVFSTDAAQGYDFLLNNSDSDDPALSLMPDGTQFHLNLDGMSNAKGVYVRPLTNDSKNQPLPEGLRIVKSLTPQIRKPEGDNHPQMGFIFKSKDAKTQLPREILREFPGQNFGIAQHNLVAILVRAVQELEDKIVKLEARVTDLEKLKGKS